MESVVAVGWLQRDIHAPGSAVRSRNTSRLTHLLPNTRIRPSGRRIVYLNAIRSTGHYLLRSANSQVSGVPLVT